MPRPHTQSTPRAGEDLPAGAARLGRAALQNLLLELQGALVDVEGVRHDDRWRAHVINVIELYVGMLHNGTAQQS